MQHPTDFQAHVQRVQRSIEHVPRRQRNNDGDGNNVNVTTCTQILYDCELPPLFLSFSSSSPIPSLSLPFKQQQGIETHTYTRQPITPSPRIRAPNQILK
eukprot:m.258140 g.258140  ORF g.258140 m.258140 type:complete len:100 (-) comp36170_c0_seq1:55-354(-)